MRCCRPNQGTECSEQQSCHSYPPDPRLFLKSEVDLFSSRLEFRLRDANQLSFGAFRDHGKTWSFGTESIPTESSRTDTTPGVAKIHDAEADADRAVRSPDNSTWRSCSYVL